MALHGPGAICGAHDAANALAGGAVGPRTYAITWVALARAWLGQNQRNILARVAAQRATFLERALLQCYKGTGGFTDAELARVMGALMADVQ